MSLIRRSAGRTPQRPVWRRRRSKQAPPVDWFIEGLAIDSERNGRRSTIGELLGKATLQILDARMPDLSPCRIDEARGLHLAEVAGYVLNIVNAATMALVEQDLAAHSASSSKWEPEARANGRCPLLAAKLALAEAERCSRPGGAPTAARLC